MTRIGVVMAAYQAERFVGESLRSLQCQSFQDWHCVVVDDGSSDTTPEIVATLCATDSRLNLLRQANGGPAAARTRGLAALPPDINLVSFLDSDDLYLPSALQWLHDTIRSRPDAVGAYGYAEYIDEHGRAILAGVHPSRQIHRRRVRGRRLVNMPEEADSTFANLLVSAPIWPAAVGLLRREVITAVGGFEPSLRFQEDWDLYLRMSRRGPFVVVARQVCWYRRHADNLTGDGAANLYHQDWVRWRAWNSPVTTATQRRQLLRGWRYLTFEDVARQLHRAAVSAHQRRWRAAFESGLASLTQAALLLQPGLPSPSRTRTRVLHRVQNAQEGL